MTFKGKKLDAISMSRKEIETGVEDADAFSQIMESIGFKPVIPVKKTRVSLVKGNITVCVDDVAGLGGFLEVEILVKDESMRVAALEDIARLLENVGLSLDSTIRKSYLSMLEEK